MLRFFFTLFAFTVVFRNRFVLSTITSPLCHDDVEPEDQTSCYPPPPMVRASPLEILPSKLNTLQYLLRQRNSNSFGPLELKLAEVEKSIAKLEETDAQAQRALFS